jgi:CheY-like chemotaxis protein
MRPALRPTLQQAASAIEMIKAASDIGEQYDVIILDIQMPGMNGYETT